MPQSPLQVDAVQIEPGSGDTLTIARDSDGNLVFTDAALTGGSTLTELAGLGSITQVLVVGQEGAGAAYTSIQAAIDDVPATADEENPFAVLVMPGVYEATDVASYLIHIRTKHSGDEKYFEGIGMREEDLLKQLC